MAQQTAEELKTQLQALKGRADALIAKKEPLIKEAATQTERRTQAVAELKELGYDVEGKTEAELDALALQIQQELAEGIAELTKVVEGAEKLLGIGAELE